jgi:hypothetical protein
MDMQNPALKDQSAAFLGTARAMIREIPFQENRDTIARLRREAYTNGLFHDIDEFDEVAHHFALFDEAGEVAGMVRMLRNDEVPRLELQCESDARDLQFPKEGLIMEFSRGCARDGTPNMPIFQLSLAMHDYALKNGAAHVVSKTGRRLLPLYQMMGFRVFGSPFYSDWFDDRNTGLMSIPIIYDFIASSHSAPEEEVLVW